MAKVLTNVAVHEPYAWVIWSESNCKVASSWQERYISAWRVVEVECLRACVHVVLLRTLSQDHKIMTMEVDRMTQIALDLGRNLGGAVVAGNNKVHEAMIVIFFNNGVFWVECRVIKIENCGVGKVEPRTH